MVLRIFSPGVVTAISMRGNFCIAAAASAVTSEALDASQFAEAAKPPFARMPAAVASAPSAARSAHITSAPSDANASAEDLPMPEAAPSTTEVFPVRSKSLR